MKRIDLLTRKALEISRQLEAWALCENILKMGEIIHLSLTIQSAPIRPVSFEVQDLNEEAEARSNLLKKGIAELELSVRASNCLETAGIETIGDLVKKSAEKLLEIRNLSETPLGEIIQKLAKFGLKLKED